MQAEHGDIFDSIQSGNIPGVKEFLDAGVPVNLTDEEGWSLLHHAAACGQVEVIRFLQEKGCYIDAVDSNRRTALHYAAANGFVESVRTLIEMGSDVNALDNEHTTPLQWAVMSEQYAVMEALIERGGSVDVGKAEPLNISIDLNKKNVSCDGQPGPAIHNSRQNDISNIDNDSSEKFFKAAQSGDTTAVTECLDLGVPVDLTDEDGWSPVHHAIAHGQVEVVRLLMDRGWRMSPVKSRIPPSSDYAGVHNSRKCDIFDAARSGDTTKLKEYLELGVSVDTTDEDGCTPLHCAAGEGQVDAVKLLIDKGCCIDPVDNNGWTPYMYATMQGQDEVERLLKLAKLVRDSTGCTLLHAAAAKGQLEVIEMLLSAGGRKLMTVVAGKIGTPLHQAAGHGHKDVVTLLLNEDCPVAFRDSDGSTALHLAAQCGQVAIIEMLVNHGLDVNVEDNEGSTPLHSAAAHGQLESVQTLLQLGGRKSLRKIGRNGGTPLHYAVAGGHKDMITLLLKEGCSVTTQDSKGVSVLHFAVQFGQEEIIAHLIDCGLDANIEDDDGRTPLHYAVYQGHLESVRALLRLGGRRAMAMIAGDEGTPLHVAVGRGNKDIVSLLLSEGCPMNMTIQKGLTALHIAAITGQVDIIELLVGRGLDVNIQNDKGFTPLHLAACHNQLESARTLIRLGGRRSMTVRADGLGTPLHQAALKGHKDMVSLLLKEGCPINVTDGNGISAAHFAAERGEADIIEMLVTHGLDVNLVDNDGATPLHTAASHGNLKSVCTLLRSGGEPSMTMVASKMGAPLHQAACGGYNDILTLLLDEGCPVNVTTHNGITALHSATSYGRMDVVDMLIKRGFDTNAVDVWGVTPLSYAVHHIELMQRLMLSGASISHHDNFGINVFEYFIAFECTSSRTVKSCVEASGITCDGSNFVNVISTLSKNNLIDVNRVLCLAAVSGHVDLFDDIVDSDLPLDQQRMPKLVRALCIRLESWEVIQNLLEELLTLDDPLNPLHLSLMSCKQLGPGTQSASQHKYAARVISHPRTKCTIYELFPNGLSPLDVAHQFELHDIAGMIERAGGRPGMWADLPKEIGQRSMEILRSLKRVRGTEFGEDYIRTLLMMCGYVIKEEEGSKVAQNAVLEQTPEQSDLEECVLSNVKEMRKWRRVGELLKLEAPVLDKLAKVADGNDDAYYSMLKYWLEHGRSVTWKTLLDAIGHFETKKTMDDIRKKFERGFSVTNVGGHVTC